MTYFTKSFWMDAIERAIKTVAQSILSLWLLGDVGIQLAHRQLGTNCGGRHRCGCHFAPDEHRLSQDGRQQ